MSRASQTRSSGLCHSAHRNARRGTGCSSRSPHSSASSTARRCTGSAGYSGGSGRSLLEQPHDPDRVLRPAAVDLQRGNRTAAEPGRPQHGRVESREQVDDAVLDALALECDPRRLGGMRQGQRVELAPAWRHPIGGWRNPRTPRGVPIMYDAHQVDRRGSEPSCSASPLPRLARADDLVTMRAAPHPLSAYAGRSPGARSTRLRTPTCS